MSKGWTGESSRHAMARMGIKTGTKKVSTYNVPKRDGSGKGVRANVGRNPNCATPKAEEAKEKQSIVISTSGKKMVVKNNFVFKIFKNPYTSDYKKVKIKNYKKLENSGKQYDVVDAVTGRIILSNEKYYNINDSSMLIYSSEKIVGLK